MAQTRPATGEELQSDLLNEKIAILEAFGARMPIGVAALFWLRVM